MRVVGPARTAGVGFNMTPLIDVVFLLIVFFLVSSQLARQEAQMELDLPEAASGLERWDDRAPRVTINVLADGSLLVAGRPLLPSQLESRLAAIEAHEGRDVEVRIRSDRQVAYQRIEPVLRACARAGIWNIHFAVYAAEGAP